MAHAILISPIGYRDPNQIYRIIREKSRIEGPMGSIVEWQSLRTQEYRYTLLVGIARFWELFGVRRPVRYEKPITAGDFDQATHGDHSSFLKSYLDEFPGPENQSESSSKESTGPHPK
jgi:hypothetical protein